MKQRYDTRIQVLEEALGSIKNDQKELNGFQEIERTTLEERVAQLQNALARTTDGNTTISSPRHVRVRVPDDVASIVTSRMGSSDDVIVECAQQEEEKTEVEEEEEEEKSEDDVVEALRSELKELKAHTQKQRESLEAQLEELTAELQEHMERDEAEMTEERVRAAKKQDELREKLQQSEAALQSAREEQLELKNSKATLQKRLEEMSSVAVHNDGSVDAEKTDVLNSQLDQLCDIVEKQESELESRQNIEKELKCTKKELDDMRTYILTYKERSDDKIQALREEIESGNEDIAALDTRMVQVQRMLLEIVRRGESGKMNLKKILSTLTKMSDSLVRRDDE